MSTTASKPPDGPGTRRLRYGFAFGVLDNATRGEGKESGDWRGPSAPFCCLALRHCCCCYRCCCVFVGDSDSRAPQQRADLFSTTKLCAHVCVCMCEFVFAALRMCVAVFIFAFHESYCCYLHAA